MIRSCRLTRRVIALAFGGLLAVGTLAGCGDDSAAADVPTFDIALGRYTISPETVVVPVGPAELVVTNVDNIPHNLVVAGRGTRELAPGQSQTISVETEPGEYRMWCDISGHAAMGQTGVLRSEAVAAAPTSSAA
jgi:plastocyanin